MSTPTKQTEQPEQTEQDAALTAYVARFGPGINPAGFSAWKAAFDTGAAQLAHLKAREGQLVGALEDLLFVYENADETGYVTDVGFVKGFDEIPERARSLLQAAKGGGE